MLNVNAIDITAGGRETNAWSSGHLDTFQTKSHSWNLNHSETILRYAIHSSIVYFVVLLVSLSINENYMVYAGAFNIN